jgi:hypothetical protein
MLRLAKRNVQFKVHTVVYSMYNMFCCKMYGVTVIENAPGLVQCCLYWYSPLDWYLASPLRPVQGCNSTTAGLGFLEVI